jgi:eukaryotic-like serine/threonine-protein kinase
MTPEGNSPAYAGASTQLGLKILYRSKWTGTEPLFRESLAMREKTQPNTWSTFNTESMLGGALLGQKRHTDADPLLIAGYEGI